MAKHLLIAHLTAGLFLAGTCARAADLAGEGISAGRVAGHTVVVAPRARIVPHCLEAPGWLLPAPPLLKCAPRGYFHPTSVESLNLMKAVGRPPRPYPEIYRE